MSGSLRKVAAAIAAVALALALAGRGSPAQAGPPGSTLTAPAAFTSLQAAVDAAAPGDTIQVRAGTFVEQVRIER